MEKKNLISPFYVQDLFALVQGIVILRYLTYLAFSIFVLDPEEHAQDRASTRDLEQEAGLDDHGRAVNHAAEVLVDLERVRLLDPERDLVHV